MLHFMVIANSMLMTWSGNSQIYTCKLFIADYESLGNNIVLLRVNVWSSFATFSFSFACFIIFTEPSWCDNKMSKAFQGNFIITWATSKHSSWMRTARLRWLYMLQQQSPDVSATRGVLRWISLNRCPVMATERHRVRARARGSLYSRRAGPGWGEGCRGRSNASLVVVTWYPLWKDRYEWKHW